VRKPLWDELTPEYQRRLLRGRRWYWLAALIVMVLGVVSAWYRWSPPLNSATAPGASFFFVRALMVRVWGPQTKRARQHLVTAPYDGK
jgi:DMSO/TMAO reductase YedYZ heme-binding membrane subunit